MHLQSGYGNDHLTGGALDDWFNGNNGNDVLAGRGGNDELIGWQGADRLDGGDGNDVLWATGGIADADRDVLLGGNGHDALHMNAGDRAFGGSGNDRVYLDLSDLTSGVNFAFSTATTRVNATTTFDAMESIDLRGTWGADAVTGGARADALDGRAGHDRLRGGDGNDVLLDGDGNDVLAGDAGNDSLVRTDFEGDGIDRFDGGAGFDTLSFNFLSDVSVKVDLADSTKNAGMAQGLTLSRIEGVLGSDRDDDLRGASANERLVGGKGDDRLDGRAGNDLIEGGAGGDLLSGGAGNDRFVFGADALDSGDLVTDFTRGADRLVIDREGFGLGDGDALRLINGTDPHAVGAAPQFLFETDNGRLWFDADGAGAGVDAVLVATLANVSSLSASDFLLG